MIKNVLKEIMEQLIGQPEGATSIITDATDETFVEEVDVRQY